MNEPKTIQLTELSIARLEAWMEEVTAMMCYQPNIPMVQKEELSNAFMAFRKELHRP